MIKSGFQLGKKADLDYSRRLTPLAAISLLCALTARPQTPNDPVFRVDVDVRQVDLVVTDAKGHHVTDLGPDDFRIFQDGRPQKMTNFSWIEVTPPPTGAQLAALQKPVSLWERFSGVPTIAKTPGNDIVAAPVVNPHKDEIRRTIAFVMNDHSVGVMNRIRKLIDEQLSPTDMVSIGSTLRSVVPLSHGMAEIRDSMGIFQQFSNDKRQLDAALERIPRTCDFLHTCITDELGAITSAIQSLRDVPGRKALVFVGGYRGSVDRVVDMANRAGVVVFVLNPAGTSMDASDNFPGSESIVQLAKHTGGTWLLATPGADLTTDLNLVMEDLSGYYLLGFHPDPSDPDDSPPARARHRVEVKVLRPGLIVRARNTEVGGPGGVAGAPTKPQGREEVLTHALLSLFTADGIHVHLDPSFLASAPDPKTHRRSPIVHARLDIDSRDLTANDDDAGGKKIVLDMALAVFNVDGSQAGAKNMIFTIIVPREKVARMPKMGLQYTMDVPVSNAGPYQLRAAIRDPPSGKIGSAYAFLDIPDFNKKKVSLSSLALSPGNTTDVSPSGRPAWNEFARGAEVRFSCEIFGLRSTGSDSATPNVDVEVRLYRGGGPVVTILPVPVAINTSDGDSFLTGNFRIPDDLAAGNYTMEVIAYDRQAPTKKQAAEQWVDLTIVGSSGAN